ncbi:MAG: hypothetical protein LUI05_00415 [Oscillospiraceae bacterium]|nr:hypothetical protein [Oscillospiraceae bacterium]
MNKATKVLKNKWFILFVSILNGIYTLGLLYFAYVAVFYKIEYTNTVRFAIVYSVISVVVGLLMLYTRDSALTCVFNILNMFAFLPSLLLHWGNWPLLIPAAMVTLFGFFSCRMNDTARTVFGTIFLLLYIIGCIAFFLIMNVFRVTTVDTTIEAGLSPSGNFRYYVLNVENKSSGKTAVYVEPNTLDIDVGGMFKLDTTIKKLVKQANNPTTMECRWDGVRLYINGEEYFNEDDYCTDNNGVIEYNFLDDNWTHTYFSADYPLLDSVYSIIKAVEELVDTLFSDSDSGVEAVRRVVQL